MIRAYKPIHDGKIHHLPVGLSQDDLVKPPPMFEKSSEKHRNRIAVKTDCSLLVFDRPCPGDDDNGTSISGKLRLMMKDYRRLGRNLESELLMMR